MKRFFAGTTDTGLVRSVNQDSYYIDPEGRFFVVADGMGGHAGGQEASRLATEAMYGHFSRFWESDDSSHDLLEQAFLKANQAIVQDQQLHPERGDMGTTAEALLFRRGEVWCAHVGDSRLYRMRGSTLERLTQDHTWIARAVLSGALTQDQARVHPMRHVLAQCLGRKDGADIELDTYRIRATLPYKNYSIKSLVKQRGAAVKPGDPIMLVQSLERLMAEALIEQQYYSRLKDEPHVTATIEPTIIEAPQHPH